MAQLRRIRPVAIATVVCAVIGCAPEEAEEATARRASDPARVSASTLEACAEVADVARRLPRASVEEREDSFAAFTGPAKRYGCVVTLAGEATHEEPVPTLATTFPDSLGDAWQRDAAVVADGPAETIYGLWRGNVLCLVRVKWGPSLDGSTPSPATAGYSGTIGCEELPDRSVPRS